MCIFCCLEVWWVINTRLSSIKVKDKIKIFVIGLSGFTLPDRFMFTKCGSFVQNYLLVCRWKKKITLIPHLKLPFYIPSWFSDLQSLQTQSYTSDILYK